jgi:peptide/nickel transport system substrate-binding protein
MAIIVPVSRHLVALAVVLCLACDGGPERRTMPVVASDGAPQDGGTLVRRLDTDIATLNPILATSRYDRLVAQYLFTPLVHLDQELRPVPGLADSWEITDDGTVYRFALNKGATFSDGAPVRASDVVFTIRKIIDPSSEAVQVAGSYEKIDMTRTQAIDDHTVAIAFSEPLASQLVRFNELLVLPEHIYSQGDFADDFRSQAVGSGPYRLVRRTAGQEVVVERRDDYWGARPHLQTVVFKVISDNATAWNALRRGEIDETILTSDTWIREQRNPAFTETIDFRRFYMLNYNFIAWNLRDPVASDKAVRRAVAMCIPIDTLVRDLYHGTARAMSGPFTPDEWAYNPRVPAIRYDPAEARRLLASAGWRDSDGDRILDREGKRLTFELLIMAGSAATRQFAEILQSELKRVGIVLEINVVDAATAFQRLFAGNYQTAYLSWDLDPDPDPFAIFHSSQMPPQGQNLVFYSNPEADRLMEEARRELNQSKRRDLYWRLHEVLYEDQPYTWTVQVSAKWGINKRVRGLALSRGYGLYLWFPGELGWWIPRDLRTEPPARQ